MLGLMYYLSKDEFDNFFVKGLDKQEVVEMQVPVDIAGHRSKKCSKKPRYSVEPGA